MKKKLATIILSLIASALLFCGLVACNGGESQELQAVQSISITGKPQGAVELSQGTIQLGILYEPAENVQKFSVNWSSNTQSVATVDKDGKVTLVSAGRTTITASVIGKEEIKDSFSLEVTSDEVSVSAVTITGIPEGGQVAEAAQPFKLGYTFAPENASDFSVEWYSSTSSVATIDKDGLVTVNGKGATTIRLTVKGTEVSDEFVLIVGTMPQIEEIEITSLPSDNSLRAGAKWQLGYTYAPDDCAYFEVQWSSENEEIATIAENGLINALSVGTTKITLTAVGTQVYDEFTLTVTEPLDPLCEDFETAMISGSVGSGNYSSITNNYTGVTVSLTNKADEIPANGSGYALKVETVSNGYPGTFLTPSVLPKTGVEYTLVAQLRAVKGSKTIYCNFSVNGKNLDGSPSIMLQEGESGTITKTVVFPEDMETFRLEFFAINDPNAEEVIFTVDNITLKEMPKIEIENSEGDIVNLDDGTVLLTAKTNVSGEIKWSSSAENVAKFEGEDGTLTLIGTGSTVITATITVDGQDYSDSFTLNVVQNGVYLAENEVSVKGGETVYVDIVITGEIEGELTATSEDTGIASAVIEDGKLKITAISEGMTVITVNKGSYSASLDVNVWTTIAEYFENVTQNGTGYEGDAFSTLAKDGSSLSITEDADKVPEGGSGKALLVSHTGKDWVYPGVTMFTKEKLVIGGEYEFSFAVRAVSDVTMIYVKLEGNNDPAYNTNSGSLTAGQSAVITKTITVSQATPRIEIFISSKAGNSESFTVDNVTIKATEQVAITGRPAGDTIRQDVGTLQLGWQMLGGAVAESAAWESSETSVAEVDQEGLVTLKSSGKTTITLTAGTYTSSFELTVTSVTVLVSENFDGDFTLAEAAEGAKPVSGSSATSGLTFTTVGYEFQHSENPDHMPEGGSGKCLFWQPYDGENVWGALNITGVAFEAGKTYEVSFKTKLIHHTAAVNGFNFFVELYDEGDQRTEQKVSMIEYAGVGDTVEFTYLVDLTGKSFSKIKIFLSVQTGSGTQIAIDDFAVAEIGA